MEEKKRAKVSDLYDNITGNSFDSKEAESTNSMIKHFLWLLKLTFDISMAFIRHDCRL